ncbi:MAG: hypothetical protein OEY28_12895, partial [Nitrospira sp.]|nr:hypothetical protein [Nitrospira sp.]
TAPQRMGQSAKLERQNFRKHTTCTLIASPYLPEATNIRTEKGGFHPISIILTFTTISQHAIIMPHYVLPYLTFSGYASKMHAPPRCAVSTR